MFFIRTDGRTDTRSTQNYSSEPHKTSQNKLLKKKTFLIKMLTREKTLEAGQAMVINPFGHGHNTKMVKIPFLNWFGPRYLLLNYKFF